MAMSGKIAKLAQNIDNDDTHTVVSYTGKGIITGIIGRFTGGNMNSGDRLDYDIIVQVDGGDLVSFRVGYFNGDDDSFNYNDFYLDVLSKINLPFSSSFSVFMKGKEHGYTGIYAECIVTYVIEV